MKLVPLSPYPFLHQPHTKGYQLFAGAKLTATQIELSFRIEAVNANLFSQIIFPPLQGKPVRKDELWKGTCFECFIPFEESDGYLEFNGSPSGDWNWYSFQSYREGMNQVTVNPGLLPKQVSLSTGPKEMDSNWVLPLSALKQGFLAVGSSPQIILGNLGLTAVLNTRVATTYWALKHEGVKPDFHLRKSFVYDSFRD